VTQPIAVQKADEALVKVCGEVCQASTDKRDLAPFAEALERALRGRKLALLAHGREVRGAVAPWPKDALVFRWILPLGKIEIPKARPRKPRKDGTFGNRPKGFVKADLAPTLNNYKDLPVFALNAVRDALDDRIAELMPSFPNAMANGKRRAIYIERHSSSSPDEESIDVLGGKCPVDRLVVAGVLAGDTRAKLERLGQHVPAKPGEGRVVIEVYDL
jgi:hypothetical protein